MSCKAYDGIPRIHDVELGRTNDIKQLDEMLIPNKKIRYVIPIKI